MGFSFSSNCTFCHLHFISFHFTNRKLLVVFIRTALPSSGCISGLFRHATSHKDVLGGLPVDGRFDRELRQDLRWHQASQLLYTCQQMVFPNCPRKSLNKSVWNFNLQCKENAGSEELTIYSRKPADFTFKQHHRRHTSAGEMRAGAGAAQPRKRSALCYANTNTAPNLGFDVSPQKSPACTQPPSRPCAGQQERPRFHWVWKKPDCLNTEASREKHSEVSGSCDFFLRQL